MGPEIGAHIAAVPLKGQDSPRAESRNSTKNQRLSDPTEWFAACSVRVE